MNGDFTENMVQGMSEFLADIAAKHAAVIEEACERAIQGGAYGVMVRSGWVAGAWYVEAVVDPAVPYGHLYRQDIS